LRLPNNWGTTQDKDSSGAIRREVLLEAEALMSFAEGECCERHQQAGEEQRVSTSSEEGTG